MLYFSTRKLARDFAAKSSRRVFDKGADSSKRWAVKVL